MRRLLVLPVLVALGACYESTPFGEEGGAPDATVPGDAGDGVEPDDSPDDSPADEAAPICGDEKEPRATMSYIVDGDPTFDPSVVTLSEGEVMSIGAMLRAGMMGDWSNACTGTLVSDTTVLTAAHCVLDWTGGGTISPSRVRFAIGPDSADPTATLEVSEVHANPEYDPGAGSDQARGDQAVLVLSRPASGSVPGIVPIPPNLEALPPGFVGTDVQNVGYGATTAEGTDGNARRWWTVEEVTELAEFELVVYGGGVSSVCWGDSGGPSLRMGPGARPQVVGTVSWGDPSCVDYDHFARTDYNRDFLAPFLGPPDPCGGLTWYGRCEGDDAVWCEGDGVVHRRDCAACDRVCGDAGPSWGFYCV